jgi:hypothetical protein
MLKVRIHKSNNFACGFVWHKTQSLSLMDEHKLQVFEKKCTEKNSDLEE